MNTSRYPRRRNCRFVDLIGFIIFAACIAIGYFCAHAAKGQTVHTLTLDRGNILDPTGSFYVGACDFTLDGIYHLQLVCDDFDHHVQIGQSWQVTISAGAALQGRFGGIQYASPFYQMAFDLTNYIVSQSGPVSNETIAAQQFAIWSLFSSNSPTNALSQQWRDVALNNFPFSGPELYAGAVFTSVDPSNQEFIGFIYTETVPEPRTDIIVAAAGILFLAFVAARSWRGPRNP